MTAECSFGHKVEVPPEKLVDALRGEFICAECGRMQGFIRASVYEFLPLDNLIP